MEEKRYCTLCKKEETKGECSYGPEAWEMATRTSKKVWDEALNPAELMLQKQQLRLNTMKLMQQRKALQQKRSISSPMNPGSLENTTQKESAERINKLGKYYTVSFVFRGLGKVIQFFVADVKRPTRDDIAKQLEKVYPGARLVHYYESFRQPQEPLIYVEEVELDEAIGSTVAGAIMSTNPPELSRRARIARALKARAVVKSADKKKENREKKTFKDFTEEKHTATKSDLEAKIGGGNLKKLAKKAAKRIDYDVDGDVDPNDKVEKKTGEYGEQIPTPFGKFRTKIGEGVMPDAIDPKAHRKQQRAKKIRDRTKTGDEGSEIAKKKVKGPDLFGEGAAWTRKEGQNKKGGLNEKGRKSYERENPGSDLKAPSKKKGNKRRASFCARMKGMKKKLTSSKTANDPNSRINKSLRAWNC